MSTNDLACPARLVVRTDGAGSPYILVDVARCEAVRDVLRSNRFVHAMILGGADSPHKLELQSLREVDAVQALLDEMYPPATS